MSEAAVAPIDGTDLAVFHGDYRAYPAQVPPPGDWSTWLILAGRGFGKTRTGRRGSTRWRAPTTASASR